MSTILPPYFSKSALFVGQIWKMFAGINPFSNYIERKGNARRDGIAFFWQHRASEKMAEDFKHWQQFQNTYHSTGRLLLKISSWINIPSYSKLANVLKMGTLPTRLRICNFQDRNILSFDWTIYGPEIQFKSRIKLNTTYTS